jgi:CBS-domain-containing membrane protein
MSLASTRALSSLANDFPALFTRFDALYETVKRARNDAMHIGVYARHATNAAIELCIGLEEALMVEQQIPRVVVADFMVKAPVVVEPWQPVAHARQLMLMHSFSFLPVFLEAWKLVPELSMARYLHRTPNRRELLATRIDEAAKNGLDLIDAVVVKATAEVSDLLKVEKPGNLPMLWLVLGPSNELSGVLSPFELM